jgi:dTDP-4-amino-4,6-dideoxygalactose transaminase
VVFDGYAATRDEVFIRLGEHDILARKYFYPLTNSFACYNDYATARPEKTPMAAFLADRVLTLPLYADLALEDVDRICEIILECGK